MISTPHDPTIAFSPGNCAPQRTPMLPSGRRRERQAASLARSARPGCRGRRAVDSFPPKEKKIRSAEFLFPPPRADGGFCPFGFTLPPFFCLALRRRDRRERGWEVYGSEGVWIPVSEFGYEGDGGIESYGHGFRFAPLLVIGLLTTETRGVIGSVHAVSGGRPCHVQRLATRWFMSSIEICRPELWSNSYPAA